MSLRQKINQKSKEPSAAGPAFGSADSRNVSPFQTVYDDQHASYAAALRRSPRSSHPSPWNDSRRSSTTASLSAKISQLHLGSKGSSCSSTTSESAMERERERRLSAGAVQEYYRHSSFGNTVTVRGGPGRGHAATHARNSSAQTKTSRTWQQPYRPRSNSYSAGSQNRPPKTIPGMLSVTESPSSKKEEAKASDGGWTKVERPKRLPRQDSKPVRGRQRRGGRGGSGGAGKF